MRNESIIPKFFNNWVDTNNNKEVKILADRKEEIYRQIITQNGITPLEGVKELLASLKSQNIRCSIGSSTPIKNIETVLNIIGLSDYFHCPQAWHLSVDRRICSFPTPSPTAELRNRAYRLNIYWNAPK